MDLEEIVAALANGIERADASQPVALNKRSGMPYQAGIGPHTESETVSLAIEFSDNDTLQRARREVPYPSAPRNRCDIVVDHEAGATAWAVEVKLLRMMGDNGKPNDNMLMHILSPYPQHRSAVTDCTKLVASGFDARCALVILGYSYEDLPLEPAISAFELLARSFSDAVGVRLSAAFDGLIHPVHRKGEVIGWELGT